jgi:hypothetical protein
MKPPSAVTTKLLLLPCFVLALLRCIPEVRPAGDEVLGSFEFASSPLTSQCSMEEFNPDAGLSFEATFSRDSSGSPVWLNLGGVAREAGFDGQRFTSTFQVERNFQSCKTVNQEACAVVLEETLDVMFLSRSQNDVLKGICPENPFDGGVPAADPDAGILAPAPGRAGYDVVRSCGTLKDVVIPIEGCVCGPCQLEYRVVGVKK